MDADTNLNLIEDGELVLLVDRKGRRYLQRLDGAGEFATHEGLIAHKNLVGLAEGSLVATSRGQKFIVMRPTLSDFILKMPRGAQVIYPKDIGAILMMLDLRPGMKVLETGVGSGAMSMGLLKSGAHVVGYELRQDFAEVAKENVEKFLGPEALTRYQVEIRDSYIEIPETGFHRAVLDIPEPWNVIPNAVDSLLLGGILVSYSPSITQVMKTQEALSDYGFSEVSTIEVLHRGWHVEGQAVRPDHRMVAHTAFLTQARLFEPSMAK